MKMMDFAKTLVLAVGLAGGLFTRGADIVYDNSVDYSGIDYETTDEYGDEVNLAGTSRAITEIQIEYYAEFIPNGDEIARIRFYSNTGPFWEGNTDYPTPASPPLYEQTFVPQQGYQTAVVTVPNVVVPDHFTWTIQFLGISQTSTNDRAGLLFYGAASIGSSFDDFWELTPDGWGAVAVTGVTNNFGVRISAVPAPSEMRLTISKVGNNVLVSWPTGLTSAVLESKTDLNSATWTQVAQTPTQNGARMEVSIPIAPGNRFFRLRSP